MQGYEYRAVPAPRRGVKVRGLRGEEARFAAAIEGEINLLAAQGWEYVRSDTLPSEERRGWFSGRATVFRTLLVFRRAIEEGAVAGPAPRPLAAQGQRPAPAPPPPAPEPDPGPGEPPLPGPGDPPVAGRPLGPAVGPLDWVTERPRRPAAAPSGGAGRRREPPLVAE